MSESQQSLRDFEILMADSSCIEIRIVVTLEAEDMGMIGSKKVRDFNCNKLLSELQQSMIEAFTVGEYDSSAKDETGG
jgi:hypothetical protein